MASRNRWSTEDFDQMSWHDVHVHGFRIIQDNVESGTAELVLDIDYILEWRCGGEGEPFSFLVAQATLQFHDVFGLKLLLDYRTPTAGMSPFSLDGIVRETKDYPDGQTLYSWKLGINWPAGSIEFDATGFTQWLVGEPMDDCGLWIESAKRKA